MTSAPYRITPVFDESSLPTAIRGAHQTKAGAWGLLRVLEGAVDLVFHEDGRRVHVSPGHPAVIPPQAVHHVELTGTGRMRMQVEFYRTAPDEGSSASDLP